MQEMAHAWEEYSRLERSMEQLRTALQAHMNHSTTPQVRPGTAAQSRPTSKLPALVSQLKHIAFLTGWVFYTVSAAFEQSLFSFLHVYLPRPKKISPKPLHHVIDGTANRLWAKFNKSSNV